DRGQAHAADHPGRAGHYDGPVPTHSGATRAIDFHVHLPTPDWLDGSMAGYVEAAEAYFRSPVQRASLDQLAARYRQLRVRAVLLAWDAETATGRPRVPNETVAAACRDHPDVFTGFGSVDPHKGDTAVAEVANIAASVRPGRRLLLANLRGLPGARPAGLVPHRNQRDRGRPARGAGHQARLRPPDPPGRGRRRPSRPDGGSSAFRLALAHGTGRHGPAQNQRVHRHLRLVTTPHSAGADRGAAGTAVRAVPLGQRL